jgi:hypothetical protein
MNCQEFGRFDVLFLTVISIATYAYIVFCFRKIPDPMSQYGMSLTALIACAFTVAVSVCAFVVLLIAGTFGYLIVAVVFPPIIFIIVKKMISEDKPATI